jgi:DNA-binding transcriptional MerR regulator
MLDQEWVQLIMEAKQLGITIEEIKNFLEENMKKEKQPQIG